MATKKRYAREAQGTIFLRTLRAMNSTQEFYLSTMRESTITFCTGPAGTSKTYLAVYIALEALLGGEVEKIILTRPIVAAEDIGYLPGDAESKIHPYILPLIDAIEAHVGPTKTKELMLGGKLEVLPLAYMRGRSLSNSFMICDESQNVTPDQITMFLTRLGFGSKIVVTGDDTQSDLPKGVINGLTWAVESLKGKEAGVSVVQFESKHIVRNEIIARVLQHLKR